MEFFILSLLIITITAAVVPPAVPQAASQYDARAVGAMPCYLGCCKLFDRNVSRVLFPLSFPPSLHIDRFLFMNTDLHIYLHFL